MSQSQSSSFDYHAEKHCQLKKSRSRSPKKSPERCQQFKRSQSQSSSFDYDAENTTNSRKAGHDLQRKVLKDAGNSREVRS